MLDQATLFIHSGFMSDFKSYLDANRQRFEDDLFEWLRMPSIGTDNAYDDEVRKTGSWLADKFRGMDWRRKSLKRLGIRSYTLSRPKWREHRRY